MSNQKQEERSKMFRRGFSLVEVLLAMFILGIGMIMVASVFPVGANWTRQTTEDSVAQTIVQNALAVIRTHYGPGGDLRPFLNPDYRFLAVRNPNNYNSILQAPPPYAPPPYIFTPFTVQALPGFVANPTLGTSGIPLAERAYQFGGSTPFPARDWTQCTYFWTALARLNPMHRNMAWDGLDASNGIIPSSSYNYDIYILVFRKGAVEQTFSQTKLDRLTAQNPKTSPREIPGTRELTGSVGEGFAVGPIPSVAISGYAIGKCNPETGIWDPNISLRPGIGQNGIGAVSGTVFKQVLGDNFVNAQPRPGLAEDSAGNVEPVIFSPGADGTAETTSPLIYIYQTTLTF